jgi:GTPase SAR1 family protein
MEKYRKKIFHFIDYKILLFKDDKRLPYYLKWADAVLITYSITQQDSFEMALAYLDAITSYSKSLSVSTNELVLMLLGNKLDLERIR